MGIPLRIFADPVHSSFICKICHKALDGPLVLVCCGNLVCSSCVEKDASFCPCCTNASSFRSIECHPVTSFIQDLTVACEQPFEDPSNIRVRCGWRGSLGDLLSHQEYQCPYQKITCPLGTTCSSSRHACLLRKDLTMHMLQHHVMPSHHQEVISKPTSSAAMLSSPNDSLSHQVTTNQNKTNFLLAHMIKAMDELSRKVEPTKQSNEDGMTTISQRNDDHDQKNEHLTPSNEKKQEPKSEAPATPASKALTTALSPLTRLKQSVSQSRLLKAHFDRRNRVVEESTSGTFVPDGEDEKHDDESHDHLSK